MRRQSGCEMQTTGRMSSEGNRAGSVRLFVLAAAVAGGHLLCRFSAARSCASCASLAIICRSLAGPPAPFPLAAGTGSGGDTILCQRIRERSMKRSSVAVFVVLCLLLPAVPAAADPVVPPSRFSDVPAGHLFADDVAWLAASDITRGCNPPANDRFCPDAPVSRAQFAAFLHRAWRHWGGPPVSSAAARFADVPPSHTFASDVAWLTATGATRGCNPPTNDLFCPHSPVTRGQAAALLVRLFDLPAPERRLVFADVPDSHVFADEVAALAAAGLSRGCGFVDGAGPVFCPDRPLSRAELAAFLHRLDRFAASLIGPDSSTDGGSSPDTSDRDGSDQADDDSGLVDPGDSGAADDSAGPDDDALTFEGFCAAVPEISFTECVGLLRVLTSAWGLEVRDLGFGPDEVCSFSPDVFCADGHVKMLVLRPHPAATAPGFLSPHLGSLSYLGAFGVISDPGEPPVVSGAVPDVFASLPLLESVGFVNQPLDGSLPPSLGTLSNLSSLLVSGTDLSGPLDPVLGLLSFGLSSATLSPNGCFTAPPEYHDALAALDALWGSGCLAAGPVALPATVGDPFSVDLSPYVSGGYPPLEFSASDLPSELTLRSDGTLSGVFGAAGDYEFSVLVVADDGRSVSFDVAVRVAYPLMPLPPGEVIHVTHAATHIVVDLNDLVSGGRPPYRFEQLRAPQGVFIDSYGRMVGTVTQLNTPLPFAAQVTDADGRQAVLSGYIVVH